MRDIGLGNALAHKPENYNENGDGSISYLEEFEPWIINPETRTVEWNFDRDSLIAAIDAVQDPEAQTRCRTFFERLEILHNEAQESFADAEIARTKEAQELTERLERIMDEFEKKHDLDLLLNIKTKEEAEASKERVAAHEDFKAIEPILRLLVVPYISDEKMQELTARKLMFSNAIGGINNITGLMNRR